MSATAKSPNAPSKSLGKCFDAAKTLLEAYPNASFDRAQIASKLGFSATSGAFRGLLPDLKQYGLIEKVGSGEFVMYSRMREFGMADESEKAIIRYDFATSPESFSHIIEDQGDTIFQILLRWKKPWSFVLSSTGRKRRMLCRNRSNGRVPLMEKAMS